MPPHQHRVDLTTTAGSLRPALFGSLARQHSRLDDEPDLVDDIRPALADASARRPVARRLAPLDDLDAPAGAPTPVRPAAPTLDEFVEDATAPAARWPWAHRSPTPVTPPAPCDDPTMSDLAAAGTESRRCSPTHRHSADTVSAVVLGAAVRYSSEHLAHPSRSGRTGRVAGSICPHLAGCNDPDHDSTRLVHGCPTWSPNSRDSIVLVVIDGAFDPRTRPWADLWDGFSALSEPVPTSTYSSPPTTPTRCRRTRTRLGSIAMIDAHGRRCSTTPTRAPTSSPSLERRPGGPR